MRDKGRRDPSSRAKAKRSSRWRRTTTATSRPRRPRPRPADSARCRAAARRRRGCVLAPLDQPPIGPAEAPARHSEPAANHSEGREAEAPRAASRCPLRARCGRPWPRPRFSKADQRRRRCLQRRPRWAAPKAGALTTPPRPVPVLAAVAEIGRRSSEALLIAIGEQSIGTASAPAVRTTAGPERHRIWQNSGCQNVRIVRPSPIQAHFVKLPSLLFQT